MSNLEMENPRDRVTGPGVCTTSLEGSTMNSVPNTSAPIRRRRTRAEMDAIAYIESHGVDLIDLADAMKNRPETSYLVGTEAYQVVVYGAHISHRGRPQGFTYLRCFDVIQDGDAR
jgi:hypothetical protein